MEILEQGKYYHIYNRGNNREDIFKNTENKNYFLRLYQKHLSTLVTTYAYCLLGNHFHFLVKVDSDPRKVTQGFSNFFNAYAKAFNKVNKRTGSLFEKNFRRIWVDNESYLKDLILYIHLNPELHFRADFSDYEFSSYRKILQSDNSILNVEEIIEIFGDRSNFVQVHHNRHYEVNEKFLLE